MKTCILLSVLIFFLTAGSYVLTTVQDLRELDAMTDISAAGSPLDEEEPLHSTKAIDEVPSPLFRQQADELRHFHNRNYHVCRCVRERMDVFRRKGMLSRATEKMVEKNLAVLESNNEKLRKSFEHAAALAEKVRAEGLIRDAAPAVEERTRLFAKENNALLKTVDLPMNFK